MTHYLGKSLYIFLAGLFGVGLFLLAQRSLALLHLMLLFNDARWSFGASAATIDFWNNLTLCLAGLAGGWWGVHLGLEWYGIHYVPGLSTPIVSVATPATKRPAIRRSAPKTTGATTRASAIKRPATKRSVSTLA